MFKRFICSALAAALVWTAVPCISAYDGKFSVSSGSVEPGGKVAVDVSVSGSTELAGLRLFVKYDASAFTLKSCKNVDFSNIVQGKIENDPFTFLWFDATGQTEYQSGTFVRLTFICDEDAAPGNYDFSLFYDEEDCVDLYGTPLDFEIEEGVVTVEGDVSDARRQTTMVTTKVTDENGVDDSAGDTKKNSTTTKKATETDKKKTTTKEQVTKASETVTTNKSGGNTDTDISADDTDNDESGNADSSNDDNGKATTTKKDTAADDTDSSDAGGEVTTKATSKGSTSSDTDSSADDNTDSVNDSSYDPSADADNDAKDTVTLAGDNSSVSEDNSSAEQQSTDTKKGLIAAISFIALCGIVLAVWLVLKIRKEK